MVTPVLLEPKLLLRELKNIEWDEQITEVESQALGVVVGVIISIGKFAVEVGA